MDQKLSRRLSSISPAPVFSGYGLGTLFRASIAVLVLSLPTLSHAETYPAKPVNVMMPWADGFPANSARLYADELTNLYGKAFVVQPRPGAGGEVAAKHVASASPDGYTLLVTGSSITIRGATNDQNVDGERDLQPIAQLTTSPYVIIAPAGRFKSFASFVDAAKSSPGKLNFASAGIGTGMHYLGEIINVSAAIKTTHIPYPTGSRQLQAVLAGDVDVAIISLVTALPQIKAGKLDALAVSSTKRSTVAPQIPTLAESGLKDIPAIGAWIAIFGPKGMDPALTDSLSKKIKAIADDPKTVERVASWGAEIPDTSTSALKTIIKTEKAFWSKLVKEQNLPVGS